MSDVTHSPAVSSEAPNGQAAAAARFQADVGLLHRFLESRAAIVACIEELLNCRKTPLGDQQDLPRLTRQVRDCFAAPAKLSREQAGLADRLQQAHWADGFKPRQKPGNDIIDAAQLMLRAFHFWRQTRWPGRKARMHYAHTLFNVHLVRCLTLLSMRLSDGEPGGAGGRLAQAQALFDRLWHESPAGQPRLVRDLRWLMPVAMSPTTDSLTGYFEVAKRIADTFAGEDRLAIQRAWVQTGAGHLRSQLYHLATQRDATLEDPNLVLLTRKSNALDVALLVQGLVTLFEAYEEACSHGEVERRLDLAAAICQGLSPDPELFVNRLDLLAPYSMIEHLFVDTDEAGHAAYTAMGRRHLELLAHYGARLDRVLQPLSEDCRRCMPAEGAYSPLGALYGFSSNLLDLMAFKELHRDAPAPFSLEDVFRAGDADKRAWVNGWRKLPHVRPEIVRQFEYPQPFVEAICARIEQALRARLAAAGRQAAPACGRLFVLTDAEPQAAADLPQAPALPARYWTSSDPERLAAHTAQPQDEADLLHCRLEGEFLVSYQTDGGWVALTKDVLTEVLGAGRDAKAAGLPAAAGAVLRLMCPGPEDGERQVGGPAGTASAAPRQSGATP